MERNVLSHVKTCHVAVIIKTVWHWWKEGHIKQRNRIENPEIDFYTKYN